MPGETIRLTSRADGFTFEAWREPPGDARRGGLIVLHAVWGVTPHLRAFAADLAHHGYEVLVPSLFDRAAPGFPDHDIDPPALDRRLEIAAGMDWRLVLSDIQAAIDALAPPVFAIGFCWGGTAAWLAAARSQGLAAAACFYGGGIAAHVEETPRCPTILHFGRRDPLIPLSDVEIVMTRHPDTPVWLYDAGHAFMAPSDYAPDAAQLARLRTLQLFHRTTARGEAGG